MAIGYGRVLPRRFYARYTPDVAKDLLGKVLVRVVRSGAMVARIVEVESYRGADDPASHAYRGRTARNSVMFGPPGIAYIYFIYGNHHCLNVTTEPEGVPGAVLIRAVEPLRGIDLMAGNRGKRVPLKGLCNGPGKLTKAMAIDGRLNGTDMTREGPLFIAESIAEQKFKVVTTTRVGVKSGKEKPWRFYIEGNVFVSSKGK